MRADLITAPTVEPVTRADAKAHCRIEVIDDDALIDALIVSARVYAEKYTNRALINQAWKLSLDRCDSALKKREISLRYPPIGSITNIVSYDTLGTPTTFDPLNYRLSGGRVVLNEGCLWPSSLREFDALEVNYVAGYGADGTFVPVPILQAIKMLVAHWYENREASWDPIMKKDENSVMVPFGVTAILQGYKLYAI